MTAPAGGRPDRLLSQAQVARLRSACSVVVGHELPGRTIEPHPWCALIDSLFRPGSKRHRAADRLLSIRRAGRDELADWAGLSGSAVSSVVGVLSAAGLSVERSVGRDRRVLFQVRTQAPEQAAQPGRAAVGESLSDRVGARVRYLRHTDGLAILEIAGYGSIRGRLLGPVIPISLLTGTAVVHRLTLDRGAPDVEVGDRVHRVRVRIDPAELAGV